MAGPHRRAAVLGHPIDHSLSPTLHQAAYLELGLDWSYTAIDMTESGLPAFLSSLGPEWVGLSLTMPLKEVVLDLLTEVEPRAAAVRAVNTVLLDGSRRAGFNTDITGLTAILADAKVGGSSTATVIGAGATARSALAALAASGVPHVVVLARRAQQATQMSELAGPLGIEVEVGRWPPEDDAMAADVVVSTVPADVVAAIGLPDRLGLLVDVLYHPWPTPLATAWQGLGGQVVGGLELLVGQAVEQIALMTGQRPSVERLRSAGSAALEARAAAERAVPPGRDRIAQAEQ